MNHIDEETLDRYLHQELPSDEDKSVSKHLELCAECREAAKLQKLFSTELQQLVPSEASESIVSHVMKQVREEAATSEERKRDTFNLFNYLPDFSSFYAPQLAAISVALLLLFIQLSPVPSSTASTLTESMYSQGMLGEELVTYGYDDGNFYLSTVLGVEGLIQEEVS